MSGWLDSNQRPHAPQTRTLTNCATPRILKEGLLIRSICSRIASAKVVQKSPYCKRNHKNQSLFWLKTPILPSRFAIYTTIWHKTFCHEDAVMTLTTPPGSSRNSKAISIHGRGQRDRSLSRLVQNSFWTIWNDILANSCQSLELTNSCTSAQQCGKNGIKEWHCVVPCRDVAAADHRWCQILQRGYSMTWLSDMLLLRSSSYSRHETCSPKGVSTSSEHKGIRIVVAAIGQTFSPGWILLLCIPEALEESIVDFCIFKDALAVDAAHHDMINSWPRLDTAFPWHDTILFGTLTCPLCP